MLPDFRNDHFMQQMAQLSRTSFNSYLLSLAALGHGFDVRFFLSQAEAGTSILHFPERTSEPRLFSVSGSGKRVNFNSVASDRYDLRSILLTRNKSALKAKLSKAGISVPFGGAAAITDISVLDALQRANVGTVSVKFLTGRGSRDVFLNQTLEQARRVVIERHGQAFLVEQMISGAEFRITASPTDVVAAQMIIPAHVTGDGETTLQGLIERDIRARRQNPVFMRRLPDPAKLMQSVVAHGLRGDTVLEKGKVFRLSLDNLPTRAHRVPVLDRITPAIAQIAKDTVKAIDGTICGIDIMVDRAGVPFVIDVDAHSGMWFECFPYPNGEWNLDVPEYILRHHFPKHQGQMRQVLSYDFAALKAELFREGRTSKGVNAADFVTFG